MSTNCQHVFSSLFKAKSITHSSLMGFCGNCLENSTTQQPLGCVLKHCDLRVWLCLRAISRVFVPPWEWFKNMFKDNWVLQSFTTLWLHGTVSWMNFIAMTEHNKVLRVSLYMNKLNATIPLSLWVVTLCILHMDCGIIQLLSLQQHNDKMNRQQCFMLVSTCLYWLC